MNTNEVHYPIPWSFLKHVDLRRHLASCNLVVTWPYWCYIEPIEEVFTAKKTRWSLVSLSLCFKGSHKFMFCWFNGVLSVKNSFKKYLKCFLIYTLCFYNNVHWKVFLFPQFISFTLHMHSMFLYIELAAWVPSVKKYIFPLIWWYYMIKNLLPWLWLFFRLNLLTF